MLLMGNQPTRWGPLIIMSRLLLCWIPSEVCGIELLYTTDLTGNPVKQ